MKIVIPSHKRAKDVSTTKVVSNASICIPESQREEYEKYNDCELICHPDNVIGIAPKRQWILENVGDVFMLDDDIKALRRTYLAPKQKKDKFSADDVYNLLQDTYHNLKEQTDIKLFGFAKSPSPLHFDVSKPIFMNGFIQGCALGVIKDENIFFPKIETMTGEDEWIALINAHFNRKMWIDKRFFFEFNTKNTNIGGCEDIRNRFSSKESYFRLKKHFGNAVVFDKMKSTENQPKWRLKIPF
jgi:hypothetical protein